MPVAAMSITQFVHQPAKLEIPFNAVTLQEVHVGTSGKLIIHIQDAHANLSGQQSLAKAVQHFAERYGLKLILVEGADRDVTLDPVRKLAPLSEWSVIARRFLYEGIISGEEYVNLTTELPIKLRGIEYRDLYDEAVKTYAALVDRRKDILHYLYQAKVSLDRLKVRMYPQELRDYEAKKGSGDLDGGAGFAATLKGLFALLSAADIDLGGYPSLVKLKDMMDREASLDLERANREQSQVLSRLKPEDVRAFAEASKRLRYSQVSQYRLTRQLLDEAAAKGLDTRSFPELNAYADYLERFLDLKMDQVMIEQEKLEDRVFDALLPSDDARKVRAIDRFLGLLGNAYKLQMSSHDFKMYEFNEPDFPTESWLAFMNRQLADLGFFDSMVPTQNYLEDARADFGKFYQLVSDRDGAFVENARKVMGEEGADAAVLIAGGYHTDHLTELLRENDDSYIVLTPLVTDTTDQEKYESILLRHLKEQERKLAASRHKASGLGKAENVAASKIPRGLRSMAWATTGADGARMSPKLAAFVDARAQGARLSARIIDALRSALGAGNRSIAPAEGTPSSEVRSIAAPGIFVTALIKRKLLRRLRTVERKYDEHFNVYHEANEIYLKYGDQALPAMRWMLKRRGDRAGDLKKTALLLYQETGIGKEDLPLLTGLFENAGDGRTERSSDREIREMAVRVLLDHAPEALSDPRIADWLVRQAQAPSRVSILTQEHLMKAIVLSGRRLTALEFASVWSAHSTWDHRSLSPLVGGPNAEVAVPVLLRTAQNEDTPTETKVKALELIENAPVEVLSGSADSFEALLTALSGDSGSVNALIGVLAKIGGADGLARIDRYAAKGKVPAEVRPALYRAYGRIGSTAADSLFAAAGSVASVDSNESSLAAKMLHQMGASIIGEALSKLGDPNENVRSVSQKALILIGRDAVSQMIAYLETQNAADISEQHLGSAVSVVHQIYLWQTEREAERSAAYGRIAAVYDRLIRSAGDDEARQRWIQALHHVFPQGDGTRPMVDRLIAAYYGIPELTVHVMEYVGQEVRLETLLDKSKDPKSRLTALFQYLYHSRRSASEDRLNMMKEAVEDEVLLRALYLVSRQFDEDALSNWAIRQNLNSAFDREPSADEAAAVRAFGDSVRKGLAEGMFPSGAWLKLAVKQPMLFGDAVRPELRELLEWADEDDGREQILKRLLNIDHIIGSAIKLPALQQDAAAVYLKTRAEALKKWHSEDLGGYRGWPSAEMIYLTPGLAADPVRPAVLRLLKAFGSGGLQAVKNHILQAHREGRLEATAEAIERWNEKASAEFDQRAFKDLITEHPEFAEETRLNALVDLLRAVGDPRTAAQLASEGVIGEAMARDNGQSALVALRAWKTAAGIKYQNAAFIRMVIKNPELFSGAETVEACIRVLAAAGADDRATVLAESGFLVHAVSRGADGGIEALAFLEAGLNRWNTSSENRSLLSRLIGLMGQRSARVWPQMRQGLLYDILTADRPLAVHARRVEDLMDLTLTSGDQAFDRLTADIFNVIGGESKDARWTLNWRSNLIDDYIELHAYHLLRSSEGQSLPQNDGAGTGARERLSQFNTSLETALQSMSEAFNSGRHPRKIYETVHGLVKHEVRSNVLEYLLQHPIDPGMLKALDDPTVKDQIMLLVRIATTSKLIGADAARARSLSRAVIETYLKAYTVRLENGPQGDALEAHREADEAARKAVREALLADGFAGYGLTTGNRSVIRELIDAGYPPELWQDGITVTYEAVDSMDQKDLDEQIYRSAYAMIELVIAAGIRTLGQSEIFPAIDGRLIRSSADAEQFYARVQAEGVELSPELRSGLEQQIEVMKRLESSFKQEAGSEPYQLFIRKDFLAEAAAGQRVPGCFAPGGLHQEMPLMHASEANSMFVQAYDSRGQEVANAVVVLTPQGVYVEPMYSSARHDLAPAFATIIQALADSLPGIPVWIMPGSAGSADLLRGRSGKGQAAVTLVKPSPVFTWQYYDVDHDATDGTEETGTKTPKVRLKLTNVKALYGKAKSDTSAGARLAQRVDRARLDLFKRHLDGSYDELRLGQEGVQPNALPAYATQRALGAHDNEKNEIVRKLVLTNGITSSPQHHWVYRKKSVSAEDVPGEEFPHTYELRLNIGPTETGIDAQGRDKQALPVEMFEAMDRLAVEYGFEYKYPSTPEGWQLRSDTIVVYLPAVLENQVHVIAKRVKEVFLHQGLDNGTNYFRTWDPAKTVGEDYEGVHISRRHDAAEIEALIDQANDVDPSLGAAVKNYLTRPEKNGFIPKASDGQYEIAQRIVRVIKASVEAGTSIDDIIWGLEQKYDSALAKAAARLAQGDGIRLDLSKIEVYVNELGERQAEGGSANFIEAVRYFNEEVLSGRRMTAEHAVALRRIYLGLGQKDGDGRDLSEDADDPLLERFKKEAKLRRILRRANHVHFKIFKSRRTVIQAAARIYKDFVKKEMMTYYENGKLTIVNGHHRMAWFLMNNYLIRNGYSPYYFPNHSNYRANHNLLFENFEQDLDTYYQSLALEEKRAAAARLAEAVKTPEVLLGIVDSAFRKIAAEHTKLPYEYRTGLGPEDSARVLRQAQDLLRISRPASFKDSGSNRKVGRHIESYFQMIYQMHRQGLFTLETALTATYFAARHDIGYDLDQVKEWFKVERIIDPAGGEAILPAEADLRSLGIVLGLSPQQASDAAHQLIGMLHDAIAVDRPDGAEEDRPLERELFAQVISHGITGVIINKQLLEKEGIDSRAALGFALLMGSHHTGFPVNMVWQNIAPNFYKQKYFGKFLREMGVPEPGTDPAKADAEAVARGKRLAKLMMIGIPYEKGEYVVPESERDDQIQASAGLLRTAADEIAPTAAVFFLLDRLAPSNGEWFKRYGVILSNLGSSAALSADQRVGELTLKKWAEVNALSLKEEADAGIYAVGSRDLPELEAYASASPFLAMTESVSARLLDAVNRLINEDLGRRKGDLGFLGLSAEHETLVRGQIERGEAPLLYVAELARDGSLKNLAVDTEVRQAYDPSSEADDGVESTYRLQLVSALRDLADAFAAEGPEKYLRRYLPRVQGSSGASAARLAGPTSLWKLLQQSLAFGRPGANGSGLPEMAGISEQLAHFPGFIGSSFSVEFRQSATGATAAASILVERAGPSGSIGNGAGERIARTAPNSDRGVTPAAFSGDRDALGLFAGVGRVGGADPSLKTAIGWLSRNQNINIPVLVQIGGELADQINGWPEDEQEAFMKYLNSLLPGNIYVEIDGSAGIGTGAKAPADAVRARLATTGAGKDIFVRGQAAAAVKDGRLDPRAVLILAAVVRARSAAERRSLTERPFLRSFVGRLKELGTKLIDRMFNFDGSEESLRIIDEGAMNSLYDTDDLIEAYSLAATAVAWSA